ncbi:Kinesin heavy chain [Diplonema papillatum]|nr:Kinesin heavy chain [Diplonema papillatum]
MPAKREARTIQVFLRIRPPNDSEKKGGYNTDVIHVDGDNTGVKLGSNPNTYQFSRIFGGNSRQEDVFEAVAKNAVEDAFEGYHGLLFVYGQTGTGKTFTISNKKAGDEGMLQRCVGLVFQKIQDDPSGDYEVHCTFVQIYQEVIEDLLETSKADKNSKGLAIRDDPEVEGGVYLHPIKTVAAYGGGTTTPEKGAANVLREFERGDSSRAVASTNMNATSSRSHTVFTIYISRRNKMTEADYGSESTKEEFKGRLILVDLAGCERQKKTGASGDILNQANAINSSLLVLGKCIKALTDPRQFVPYRESKLTRLLQYSLAGRGKTTIIVTCGPSEHNLDETRSAIEFGQRAMTIKQEAKKHVEIDYKALALKLQAQLDERGDNAAQGAVDNLRAECEAEVQKKVERIQFLEAELALFGAEIPADTTASNTQCEGSEVISPESPMSPQLSGGNLTKKGSIRLGRHVFDEQMKNLRETLEEKEADTEQYKKERKTYSAANKKLIESIEQTKYQMKLFAEKSKKVISERDLQLGKMQQALLKLKKNDYMSTSAHVYVDPKETDTTKMDGESDQEFLERLQGAILRLRERSAMLTSYNDKAKDAIIWLGKDAEKTKKEILAEIEKTQRYEAIIAKYER